MVDVKKSARDVGRLIAHYGEDECCVYASGEEKVVINHPVYVDGFSSKVKRACKHEQPDTAAGRVEILD